MKKVIILIFLLTSFFAEAQIIKGTLLNKPTRGYGLDTVFVQGIQNNNALGQAGYYMKAGGKEAIIKLNNGQLLFSDFYNKDISLSNFKSSVINQGTLIVQSSDFYDKVQSQTTNATNYVIKTYLIPIDKVVKIKAIVTSKSSTLACYYEITGVFKNFTGTILQVGSSSKLEFEDDTLRDVSFTINGGLVELKVTGTSTLEWQVITEIINF